MGRLNDAPNVGIHAETRPGSLFEPTRWVVFAGQGGSPQTGIAAVHESSGPMSKAEAQAICLAALQGWDALAKVLDATPACGGFAALIPSSWRTGVCLSLARARVTTNWDA